MPSVSDQEQGLSVRMKNNDRQSLLEPQERVQKGFRQMIYPTQNTYIKYLDQRPCSDT